MRVADIISLLLKFTNRVLHVRNVDGPGTTMITYDKQTVTTTRQEFHFPSGSNITELTIFADLSTPNTTGVAGEFLKVAIDSPDDVSAAAFLADSDSSIVPNGYVVVPLKSLTIIPLETALSLGDNGGGRLDIVSKNSNLDVWVGAN